MNSVFSKKQIWTLFLVAIAAAIVFFQVRAEASRDKPTSTVSMHFDLSESFQSVDQLRTSSPVIARVKINTTKSYPYSNVVFTLSEASVQKVYKGQLGKQIHILETGGSYGGLHYLAEGNAVFASNDEAVVFLEKYEGPVAEDAYVIKGVYQGKFKVAGERLIPSSEVLGELQSIQSFNDLQISK
ncbi:hypothetical protein [Paenibacillus radicis (ex Gao et al. 2016)]|uniref:Uncharacterized protein n=1 Tax=Paenibacillus radicis (ex Gao et al. 2016) TaxID=1737354 RepID=A0A917MDP5_9BACL|nr:hypothetical protein [Paenibacillus radicis (ex Gao et al. 2016)]GGG91028.1 hypothetical protein GCM10010918_57630 [Paenibacillus radicis (ex Gao et al. 2016)]